MTSHCVVMIPLLWKITSHWVIMLLLLIFDLADKLFHDIYVPVCVHAHAVIRPRTFRDQLFIPWAKTHGKACQQNQTPTKAT